MAKMTGKDLYVAFNGATLAGVGKVVSRSFDPQYQIDTVDSSAGDQTSKTYLTALKDGTATMSLVYEGSQNYMGSLVVGTYGSLVWGAEGTATGKPKGAVMAYVTSANKAIPYNDIVTLEVSWQFSGNLINDDMTSVW